MRNVITLLLSILLFARGYAQSDALSINAGMQLTFNRYMSRPLVAFPIGYFVGIEKTYEAVRWGWGVEFGLLEGGQDFVINDPYSSNSVRRSSFASIKNMDLRAMYFIVPPKRFYSLSISAGMSFAFVSFSYPQSPLSSPGSLLNVNTENVYSFLPMMFTSLDQRFILSNHLDIFLRVHYKWRFLQPEEYHIGNFFYIGEEVLFTGYRLDRSADNWNGLYLGLGYRF